MVISVWALRQQVKAVIVHAVEEVEEEEEATSPHSSSVWEFLDEIWI